MAKYLSAIRATIRQFLRDEFQSGEAFDFEEDELDLHISEALSEISERCPYEVKETLYAVAKSGTATATSISHLIDTTKSQFVGSDVGKSIYNTTDKTTAKITAYNSTSDVTLDTNIMAEDESYEIYCADGAGFKDLNISSITDLLGVDEVEYKTRMTPRNPRNFTVFGDILTLDISFTPTDGDEVFVYCHKLHQLTESSSTLKPQLERLLVLGVAGKAAIAKAQSHINKVNIGGGRTAVDLHNWGLAKLALYRAGLDRITEPNVYREYPKS